MATKDWTREDAFQRVFFDKKKSPGVYEYVIDIFMNVDGRWNLHILFNGTTEYQEHFKTEAAAIKFAKSYMRSH